MNNKPIGYNALIGLLNLSVVPHYRQSYVASRGRGYVRFDNHKETHIYSKNYVFENGDDPFNHLVFAIKHDGVNLEILQAVFKKLDVEILEAAIAQKSKNKYIRVLWFLYEFLMEKKLKILDVKRLKYVDVLEPEHYFTAPSKKSKRHCVNNNLLGNKVFCPMLRKTKMLTEHIDKRYDLHARKLAESYNPQVMARASNYLYTKETLSSYEIEREKPSKDRMTRFIQLLQKAPNIERLSKELLIELQNITVDPRFRDVGYRCNQNYVGENISAFLQKIHYISPKPEHVSGLMAGLLATLEKLLEGELHPVLLATVIAFGFVFIHPFEDGNGRIHRFLIHHILSKTKFTPPGIIFPVSAVMLQKAYEYDNALEGFSKPLMAVLQQYQLSEEGVLSIQQPTKGYYQFIDYTHIAEYLFGCIQETLRDHFEKELEFLVKYDKTKSEIQAEIDMPDRLIDLLIKFVLQNKGVLSNQKRQKYFDMLSEQEIDNLVSIVCKHML